MTTKAVIFDLDGTLIDSAPDIADAANQMLANHGYPVHHTSRYKEWIGHGALKLIQRAVPGKRDESYLQELLDEYREIHIQNCTNKTHLYNGIDEMLDYLTGQNISISILTNKPHTITLKVVEHYLSTWKLDFVYGQMPEYPKKPDPARAIEIAGKLKRKPHEMLFIGDSDTDMKTGIAAKMIPIGVTWGYDTELSIANAGASYIFATPKELIKHLKKCTNEI
jgi:phosphoglycolate phosphatase